MSSRKPPSKSVLTKATVTISKEEYKLSEEEKDFLSKELNKIREEALDSPYIEETLRSLSAGAFRGAIGSYWNAVVDDLRKKIEHRSLDLFNKEMSFKKTIKTYEDFQDHVTDHDLIEGAYKIGVIGWEAKKLLHQARETRNIFDGHPKSSKPNIFKVLNMISDCNKYVLSEEYMPEIIDINTYMLTMDTSSFSKNEAAIEQAFSDLPDVYKTELINKFYSTYIHDSTSLELRSNVEFCAPILWSYLSKEQKSQLGKRLDKEIISGDKIKIDKGTEFLILVRGLRYVSTATRKSIYTPAIDNLEGAIENWAAETNAVRYLRRLGTTIPADLIGRYVAGLTLIYVGTRGYSMRFNRTDFYSDTAVVIVKEMFEKFDVTAAEEFIKFIKKNQKLKDRIKYPEKLTRLRDLGNVLLENVALSEDQEDFLNLLVDKSKFSEFARYIK
ncbi:hypothetical protein [Chitinophaga defluvii]|uniref:Uncharacterized protein n=1 Tax=Chitinophaga defluvii TaxID=3163343 RepID=A0ABV2T8X7_9BACT